MLAHQAQGEGIFARRANEGWRNRGVEDVAPYELGEIPLTPVGILCYTKVSNPEKEARAWKSKQKTL